LQVGNRRCPHGGREVKRALRKTLLKYQLYQEQDLFDRAYAYIAQYY
jgi:type I restriction enzyme R subunit